MLAMTTTPSESSHQNVSLMRQQRELEKEKRAAEKSRMMPNHFDSLPLFNPPVKKEYTDETAARLKNLLGEPASVTCGTSRQHSRTQDRRVIPQSVQHVRQMDRRADSPVMHPRPADSNNVQCTAKPAANPSGTLADGKVLPPSFVSASGAVSSSPRGQIANSVMPTQATVPFSNNSESTKVHSPAGFFSGGSTTHRMTGHASVASAGGSGVQHDSHSSPRNSVFQKPLPKAPVSGPNGMKPISRLIISDEPVDHDVSSILKEMTPCLKPISGINTPRKEAPPMTFPASHGSKEFVKGSGEDSCQSAGRTSDVDLEDDLKTSDTDGEKSDSEESQVFTRLPYGRSSDSDDTSQSLDSDSDNDGNTTAGSDMKSVKRDRSSRPTEINASFNSVVYGVQSTASGDSWSLEALEHSSRSKVETPPLEPLGSVGLPSRSKTLPTDRPGSWSKVLEEYSAPSLVHKLSPLPSTNDRLIKSNPLAPCNAPESSLDASSILDDIMADGSDIFEGHDDAKERSPTHHLPNCTSSGGRTSPEKPILPVSGDNDSDSDDMIDIESVSPAAQDVSERKRNDETLDKILPVDTTDTGCVAEMEVIAKPGPTAVAQEEEGSLHSEPKSEIAAEVHVDVCATNSQHLAIDTLPIVVLGRVESPVDPRRTPSQTPKNDQPSLTTPVGDRLDATAKQSLIVRIPLHLIGRLPKPDTCHASPKSVRNSSTDRTRRSRYTSTSLSSTASTDDDVSAAERDGVVRPLSSLIKSDVARPKSGQPESVTNEVAQHKHSSKRKSTPDQDDSVTRKKSKTSKETDEKASELIKTSTSTKDSRKGQKRTATPAPNMSQNDQSDAGSASKKRRGSSLAASGDSEVDKAHSKSKPDSSNGHGQHSSSGTPAALLAPPTIPGKSAGTGCTNGLPFRTSLFNYDIGSAPEYQRGSDVYLSQARISKHEADLCNDMMQKHLTYLDCILTFLLCARAIERESPTYIAQIIKVYYDTYQLLSYVHKRKPSKSTDIGDDACKNRQYGIWTILSLWTQSLLCQKLYKLYRPDTEKYHRAADVFFKEPISHVMPASSATPLGHKNHGSPASPAPSPSGSVASTSSMTSDGGGGVTGKRGVTCTPPRQPAGSAFNTASSQAGTGISAAPSIVPLPHKTYAAMKSYTQNVRLLELCHQYWDQADLLVMEESHRAFFTHLEESVPPLTLHSSIIHLVHYLKLAVKSLRKMPESTSSGGRYS